MLRITTTRIIAQAVTFALFLSFVVLTTFANIDRFPGLHLWVGKMIQIDPLVSIAAAITTHTVYRGLLWSLLILVPTLFLGRFFCNWVCPYGTLHHFVGWLFRRTGADQAIKANRFRTSQHIKYFLLIAMLLAAVPGSLQIGLLDPICLAYRSFTGAVIPAANMPAEGLLGDTRLHQGAWLIGLLLFGLVAMNLAYPRFFCRMLCPLGALLALLSRFAWWRIERDPDKCAGCDQCLAHCEGACDPHTLLRRSECFVCFNCIEDCAENALRFAFLPSKEREVAGPDLPRRKVIFAAVAGVLFFPFIRTSGRTTRDFSAKVIRPPGSVEELEFLKRCIKCDQCIRVCPTSVLQPAWFEAGLEGLWSPLLNFRMGYCQLNCTACTQVCPTGAIQRISIERKLGLGRFTERGPIKLGTANFDTGRCLPYSKNISCAVCEEVCPTSPKAIYAQLQMRTIRNAKKRAVSSTDNTVTVSEWPQTGETGPLPAMFRVNQWKGDEATRYHVVLRHADGMTESHRIISNDTDTLTIAGVFIRPPLTGEPVVLHVELKVPQIDVDLCIGCGICERLCPVVGDRRAIYVTAEGETRSQDYPEGDRNRSLRFTAYRASNGPSPGVRVTP